MSSRDEPITKQMKKLPKFLESSCLYQSNNNAKEYKYLDNNQHNFSR